VRRASAGSACCAMAGMTPQPVVTSKAKAKCGMFFMT
jgi:hypothetical protein